MDSNPRSPRLLRLDYPLWFRPAGLGGLSHGDALRLSGSIGEGGKGRSVGGFDACNSRIDTRLGDEGSESARASSTA